VERDKVNTSLRIMSWKHKTRNNPIVNSLMLLQFFPTWRMGEGTKSHPATQTFKHSRIREINWGLVYGRALESIPKHIGIMEEDDLEVFDDALDDRLVPTSPTPSRTEIQLWYSILRILRPMIQGIWRTTQCSVISATRSTRQ